MSNNNSSGKSLGTGFLTTSTSNVSTNRHPQYNYWMDSWRIMRDTSRGSIAVKAAGQKYLPILDRMTDSGYVSYLERATYFNMVARTVNGLVGTIFTRTPKVQNLPKKLDANLKNVTQDNKSLSDFSKLVAQEVMTTGRYGVLLDMPPTAENEPYMQGYIAENILNWKVRTGSNGKEELVEVVLVEFEDRSDPSNPSVNREVVRYRVLRLGSFLNESEELEFGYQQHIYRSVPGTQSTLSSAFTPPNLNSAPDFVITPRNRGKVFDFIPFCFFGPWSNDPDVDKPPLLDIADLNISHYRSYADLEHGRFYTAMPTYYAFVNSNDGETEYSVGPNTVWQIVADKAPGIMEFHGSGLIFLERALDQKEHQISSLGGRMLGVRTNAAAESDNTVALKEKNERSLLLNITNAINHGFTKILFWYAVWLDVPEKTASKIAMELNQDFLLDKMSAREFRAIAMMHKDGMLPLDVMYSYFQKAEIIPHDVSLEEFEEMLNDPKQFPNQVDVLAQQEGFEDAAAKQASKDALKATDDALMKRALDLEGNNNVNGIPPNAR